MIALLHGPCHRCKLVMQATLVAIHLGSDMVYSFEQLRTRRACVLGSWGHFRDLLEASWGLLGCLGACVKSLRDVLRRLGAFLGRCGGALCDLGVVYETLQRTVPIVQASWKRQGGVLEGSRSFLGDFLRSLDNVWEMISHGLSICKEWVDALGALKVSTLWATTAN